VSSALIGSIDWSNFVNARSHHGNVDLQTVGRSQLTESRFADKADFADLTQPLPFQSGYFGMFFFEKEKKLISRRHPP
jgi:hypothetical protein